MMILLKVEYGDLPVLSAVTAEALNLIQSADASNDAIDKVIRQDPGLTQRLLQTANAPFYAGRRGPQTVREAVVRLGLRQLRNILVTAAAGDICTTNDPWSQALWEHSLATAMASQRIAQELGGADQEEAFLAGMMHDVGKLVIHNQQPEAYQQLGEAAVDSSRSLSQVEQEHFNYLPHVKIGDLVMQKWKLSDGLADTVRFHHQLDDAIPPELASPMQTCIVALANALVHHIHETPGCQTLEMIAARTYAKYVNANLEKLTELRDKISDMLQAQMLPCTN